MEWKSLEKVGSQKHSLEPNTATPSLPNLAEMPSPSPPSSSFSSASMPSEIPPPPPRIAQYPPINPGGSLIIAWQLEKKHVLIVGGGEVASGRLRNVLEASVEHVVIIAPSESLHPEVRYRIFDDPYASKRITYHDRHFNLPNTSLGDSLASSSTSTTTSDFNNNKIDTDDLEGIDMVLTAIDDTTTSQFIYSLAHSRNIPCNAADIPPSCDFFFGSQIRSGSLQIMVSTNGKGPKIAAMIRAQLEQSLDEMAPKELGGVGRVIENVGRLRERLRTRTNGVVGGSIGRKRMKWMIDVCETYSFPQLALLDQDDGMLERLLDEGWEQVNSSTGKSEPIVPSFVSIAGPRRALLATSAVARLGKNSGERQAQW